MYLQGEIFIMHFDYMNENVEFGFLVPFFQFRGIDSDLPEYNICASNVPVRDLYIKGLDAISHSTQIIDLKIISLLDIKLAFLVEDKKKEQYLCPFVIFTDEDKCRTKPIKLVVKSSGLCKFDLVKENPDLTITPIFNFMKTFKLKTEKYVEMPRFIVND